MLYLFFWVFDGYKIFLNLSMERPHCLHLYIFFFVFLIYVLIFLEREEGPGWGGRGRETSSCCFIYAFIGWFYYVSWLGVEPATLVYTNWATWPGPPFINFLKFSLLSLLLCVLFFPEMYCEFPSLIFICVSLSALCGHSMFLQLSSSFDYEKGMGCVDRWGGWQLVFFMWAFPHCSYVLPTWYQPDT